MAAMGGFLGQDNSHELRVYMGAYATPKQELTLEEVLLREDRQEEAGTLDADDRRTCHSCRAWATDEHVDSEAHWARLKQQGSLVLAKARAELALSDVE
jgi:hypothetical protein